MIPVEIRPCVVRTLTTPQYKTLTFRLIPFYGFWTLQFLSNAIFNTHAPFLPIYSLTVTSRDDKGVINTYRPDSCSHSYSVQRDSTIV